jgi:UDP-glucose 4-epimerase
MKILVTGGAGFIGSHIVRHFRGNAEVRVLDNLRTGFKHNLVDIPQNTFFSGSILERDLVRRAMNGVDYVFHLAAMVSVPESMENPIECNEINTSGTLVILEEAARANVRKVIVSSSSAIYGDNPLSPKIETMLPEPKSPYAITKLDSELYCKLFTEKFHMPTACLRYFNVFGPRQNPGGKYAAVVPIFIERALKQEPIIIFGDGEQVRDFIYVKNVVDANIFFAMQSSATGVFNIGSGRGVTINDLSKMICCLTQSRSEIRHSTERSGDVRHSIGSIDKLTALGFLPEDNLMNGLRLTVQCAIESEHQRLQLSSATTAPRVE